MSGPTRALDQVASTNGAVGNGANASRSTVSNTAAGAAPSSGRHARAPGHLDAPDQRGGAHLRAAR